MMRAVLFDLYDTLLYLDSAAIAETRRRLAVRAGVDPDAWAALWHENILDRMLGRLGSLEDEIRTMLRQLGANPAPALVTELAETETAGWTGAVTLYPETIPTLAALRERGLLLGLISNCSAQAGAVLERIGLAERFDAIILSCDVGVAKPDPAIFEHACRALGVAAAESMFVADGAFTELDAANALGMVAVKIEQAHQSGDYGTSTSYDHRVERLTDVLDLLPAPPGEARPGPDEMAPRVLVVEDDPIGRRVAVQHVQRLGYPVDAVSGGQEALEAVAAAPYALILMDYQMPLVDGLMATAEIRRREAALGSQARRVPIVALTAAWGDDEKARCLEAGMDAYLTKPIDSRQLAALIERWAPGRTAEAPSQAAQPAALAVMPEAAQPPAPAAQPAALPLILDPAGLLGTDLAAQSPPSQEIVALFLEETARRLQALATAAADGDAAQVTRLAHTLAGSANSVGATRLAAACTQLEALARDRPDVAPLVAAVGVVQEAFGQLQAALTSDRSA